MQFLRALISSLVVCGIFGLAAANAAATSVYLRPNADNGSPQWTVIGAPTAWDALNDSVTESETPTSADYISYASGLAEPLRIDLSTTSLAGLKAVSATAWFYTPDTAPTTMRVLDGSSGLLPELATVTSSAAGWQSVSIPLSGYQSQLDDLFLRFSKSGFSSGSRRIYAAFIRVTAELPSPHLYWGAWIDGDVYTKAGEEPWPDAPYEQTKPTWNEFEKHAGKAVSIVHFGQPAPWNQPSTFTTAPLEASSKRGAIPLMDMDPDGVTLSALNAGEKDASFRAWASAAKSYGKPFFFRWSWEMNGTWFKPYGPESAASPALYAAVWQRIHDIAEEQGATNITWVWCPNVSFSGSTSVERLYPGDKYVDWTCMDGYNRGNNPINPEGYKTFSKIFSQTYNEILAIAPSKPMMIGETASTEATGLAKSKSHWIADALGTELPTSFPKVKAVLWFNWNAPDEESGKRWDWPIESSGESESSFKNVIASPYYAANTFGELTPLTRIQPLP